MTPTDADQAVLRAASRKVGLYLASVCAAVVLLVLLAAVVFIAQRSQPSEVLEHAVKPGSIYVGTADLLVALIGGGLVGVVLAALVGITSARRAIRPLGDALASQRRFVQDAGHELRTPLAILDARLQLAQRQVADGPAAETLAQMRRDSRALADVVDDLLLAGSVERGDEVRVCLPDVVAEALDGIRLLAEEAGVTLALDRAADPRVSVAAPTLRRITVALLENALAHTPRGGRVHVRVSRSAGSAVLSVSDSGAGITGIDPARVFDRFAHGDPAPGFAGRRSFGIGLALVKEAALRAGGDVRVAETGPSGTTLTLTLPASDERE